MGPMNSPVAAKNYFSLKERELPSVVVIDPDGPRYVTFPRAEPGPALDRFLYGFSVPGSVEWTDMKKSKEPNQWVEIAKLVGFIFAVVSGLALVLVLVVMLYVKFCCTGDVKVSRKTHVDGNIPEKKEEESKENKEKQD
jgi:hypothetical protein